MPYESYKTFVTTDPQVANIVANTDDPAKVIDELYKLKSFTDKREEMQIVFKKKPVLAVDIACGLQPFSRQ